MSLFWSRLPGQNYADQTGEFSNSKLGQYYTLSSYFDLGTLWWSPVSQILNRAKRRFRAPLLRPFQVGIISNLHEIFWESSYGLNYISNPN